MTHSFITSPSKAAAPTRRVGKPAMVAQYGYRDEDDDESEDEERRQGLFGGVLQRSGSQRQWGSGKPGILAGLDLVQNGFNNLGNSLSSLNHNSNHNKQNNDSDDDDSDSDDDSVCSKASVASRASQTLKKLGGKLRFKRNKKKQCDSGDESNEDDDEVMNDDKSVSSVSSRASRTMKKVTGKLSKALHVGRRSSLSDGEDSDDEEEDPLAPKSPSKRLFKKRWGGDPACAPLHKTPLAQKMQNAASRSKPMKRGQSASEKKAKDGLFRRCQTDEPTTRRGPSDVHPTQGPSDVHPTQTRPRRHSSEGRRQIISKYVAPEDEDDGHVSDLSDSDSDESDLDTAAAVNPPPAHCASPMPDQAAASNSQAWSMNVTEEMLEQVTSSEAAGDKKGFTMNVPNSLLMEKQPAPARNIRA